MSKSGPLEVTRNGEQYWLDFPTRPPEPCGIAPGLVEALGRKPRDTLKWRDFMMCVLDAEADVRALGPDMAALEMMVLFKPQIDFLSEHAVDPDKRRYAVPEEGPRHYIDIDRYGNYPYPDLPRKWEDAVAKYSEDTLNTYGIVPWWLQTMLYRLTNAFKEKNQVKILRYAAEIGHYIADAHVPLHANSNHNGQFSGQKGIHGFWESRVPELLADKEWDFFIGKADYLKNPADFIWKRVLESAAAADTVLQIEKELTASFPQDQKFSFDERNGITIHRCRPCGA